MRIAHYWDKLRAIGARRFLKAISLRFAKQGFVRSMRQRAYQRVAHTQWQDRFNLILSRTQEPVLLCTLENKQLIARADRFAQNHFDLLGSGEQRFATIPWHTDFRLEAQNPNADCEFDADLFYADIVIFSSQKTRIQKDIKLPWELSRFQPAPILGYAFTQTNDTRYADAAKQQITSWLEHNPYLLGVNWMNPMEVGIRAANWITAWQQLKPFFIKDEAFCQRFICSLWDHLQFIEHNWEWYDGRTSNHYLSNLVGYAYLCSFFDEKKRWQYCLSELIHELNWQVFDEGTSYEGSTRYHQLVTELFLHGFLVARQMGESINQKIVDKLDRMITFGERCTPEGQHQPIAIGDDDSGSLFYKGLYDSRLLLKKIDKPSRISVSSGTFTYPKFGVSIIKSDRWHVTLRHHAYHPRQPSGHFHEDPASITLFYNGIPIIVDPGSYLYTASPYWRNAFRSMESHSTFYPHGRKSFYSNDLFSLTVPPGNSNYVTNDNRIETTHALFGAEVTRRIAIENEQIIITDYASCSMRWQLIFGPDIELERKKKHWIIRHKSDQILKLRSELSLSLGSAFYSPGYGKKRAVQCLIAKTDSQQRSLQTFII